MHCMIYTTHFSRDYFQCIFAYYHWLQTDAAIYLFFPFQIQAKYNVQYENIFFLCNILEQLLEAHTKQKNKTSLGYEEKEKKKFLQDIDQAVLHLSDEFPLICIYLWRLGTLLNAAQKELQGRNWPAFAKKEAGSN